MKLKANISLRICRYTVGASASVVLLGFMIGAISSSFKNTHSASNPAAVVDNLSVTVDTNCGITHSGNGTYTKTINPGASDTITANTITAVCNDSSGYAIYATGYSGDSLTGNNTDLISNDNANWNIKTDGSYQNSFWKMKFSASGHATIISPYTTFQQIPATYVKVASYNEYATSGSIVPTYQISLGSGQPAGTYIGKVQYVLVDVSSASDVTNISGDSAPLAIDTMQNLPASSCTSTPSQVRDIRDNRIYTIQRLLDGKCWMMENLDLGRAALTTNLTSSNTNLVTTVTAATFNSWKKETGSCTYNAGEFISLTTSNSSDGLEADPTSGTPYGSLYNFYAASAGTISGSVKYSNATYDICPAGWRLPTGGNSGEFQALYTQYGSAELMRASIENSGTAFAFAGYFSLDPNYPAASRQGQEGHYWSSTYVIDSGMYASAINTSTFYPAAGDYRYVGLAIRCVLK